MLPFIPFHLHYFPVDAWLAFGRGIFGSVLSKSAIGEKFITFRGPPALVDWFGIPAPFPSSSTAVPSEPRIPSSSASPDVCLRSRESPPPQCHARGIPPAVGHRRSSSGFPRVVRAASSAPPVGHNQAPAAGIANICRACPDAAGAEYRDGLRLPLVPAQFHFLINKPSQGLNRVPKGLKLKLNSWSPFRLVCGWQTQTKSNPGRSATRLSFSCQYESST